MGLTSQKRRDNGMIVELPLYNAISWEYVLYNSFWNVYNKKEMCIGQIYFKEEFLCDMDRVVRLA